MNIDLQKHWWIVIVVAAVVGIAILILADNLLPSLSPYAVLLFLVLLGASFLWAFITRGIFWAVAPGVGVLALAVGVVVSFFVPENNGWVATLILGVGSIVIGAIPNPRGEIKVTYFIGAMILVIGFLLAPLAPLWKIILCVASALGGAYVIWRSWDDVQGTSSS